MRSVRLACVRHAASVRPEPGSNSLKNCIQSPFGLQTKLDKLEPAIFTCLKILSNSNKISGFLVFLVLFNLQSASRALSSIGPFSTRSLERLYRIPPRAAFVNGFFEIFIFSQLLDALTIKFPAFAHFGPLSGTNCTKTGHSPRSSVPERNPSMASGTFSLGMSRAAASSPKRSSSARLRKRSSRSLPRRFPAFSRDRCQMVLPRQASDSLS